MSPPRLTPACAFCGCERTTQGAALFKCSGCDSIWYCGNEHQMYDWKRHKPRCRNSKKEVSVQSSIAVPYYPNENNATTGDTVPSSSDSLMDAISGGGPMRRSSSLLRKLPTTRAGSRTIGGMTRSSSSAASSSNSSSGSVDSRGNLTLGGMLGAVPEPPPPSSEGSSCTVIRPKFNLNPVSMEDDDFEGNNSTVTTTDSPNAESTTPTTTADERSTALNRIDDGALRWRDHAANSPYSTTLSEQMRATVASGITINQQQALSLRVQYIANHVVRSLEQYGWALVNHFFGTAHCSAVRREVEKLYSQGMFEGGQLMESKESRHPSDIRSDEIYWYDSGDDRCSETTALRLLICMVDSVVAQSAARLPQYHISGKSKAMVACYPGNGTKYVKHVDNPIEDGRCITSIYYMNSEWQPQHGGILRLYPETSPVPIDIEPKSDRLLLFWSNRRVPHEVLPTFCKRFAITTWYFDAIEKARSLQRRTSKDEQNNAKTKPDNDAKSSAEPGPSSVPRRSASFAFRPVSGAVTVGSAPSISAFIAPPAATRPRPSASFPTPPLRTSLSTAALSSMIPGGGLMPSSLLRLDHPSFGDRRHYQLQQGLQTLLRTTATSGFPPPPVAILSSSGAAASDPVQLHFQQQQLQQQLFDEQRRRDRNAAEQQLLRRAANESGGGRR